MGAVPDSPSISLISCSISASCPMHNGVIPYIHRRYTVVIPSQHAPPVKNSRFSQHAGARRGTDFGWGTGLPGQSIDQERTGQGISGQRLLIDI
jgi:hypothetical protein